MLNKPLIVTVPSSWADAAAGARAIATIRAAVHRKSFKCLIGLLLSSGSAIECKWPCSAARRQQRRGAGVAADVHSRIARRAERRDRMICLLARKPRGAQGPY